MIFDSNMPSDAEIDAELKRNGIDMQPAFRRLHEMVDSHRSKHSRVNFLTVSQNYDLNVACRGLDWMFHSVGVVHVGSSLTRPDYRDVDLRCILPDEEYDLVFREDHGEAKLKFLNVAISEWIQARTGLPIDFQFQRMTDANEHFIGPRNSVGASI